MHICDAYDCDLDGWPIVDPTDTVPEKLITFQVKGGDKDGFAHFFIDDYRFERVWRQPERYIDVLKRYHGTIAPDFSLYIDMSLQMQRWNSYRSKVLARYWQDNGIDVIPCISWSDDRSFEFAFRGWPECSTVAVSTVGVMQNDDARQLFMLGLHEMFRQLRPQRLLVYGASPDLDDVMIPVFRFQNDNQRRVKQWEDVERQADRAAAVRGRQ